jgi:dissimilatory sulfite reductase (desulfoviridin) alpha/beta subunit
LENLTPEELYKAVEKIIAVYSQMGKKRETFYKFLKRIGRDQLIS